MYVMSETQAPFGVGVLKRPSKRFLKTFQKQLSTTSTQI
jgi:hypothetical protein